MSSPEVREAAEQPQKSSLFAKIDDLARLIGCVDSKGQWVNDALASVSTDGTTREVSLADLHNQDKQFEREKALAQIDLKYEELVGGAVNRHTLEQHQLFIDQGSLSREQYESTLEQITLRKSLWKYEELHLKSYVESLWKFREHALKYPEQTQELRQKPEIRLLEGVVDTAIDQLNVIVPLLRASARIAWCMEVLESGKKGSVSLSVNDRRELEGIVTFLRSQLNHQDAPALTGLALSERSSYAEIRAARDVLSGKMREVLQEVVSLNGPKDGRGPKVQAPHALYVRLMSNQRGACFDVLKRDPKPTAAKVSEFVDVNLKLNQESKIYHCQTLKNAADAVSLLAMRERFEPDARGTTKPNPDRSRKLAAFYDQFLLPEKLSGALKETELNQWTEGLSAYTDIVSSDLFAYGGLVDDLDATFKRFEGEEDLLIKMRVGIAQCAYWIPEHTIGYARFVGLDYAKAINERQPLQNLREVTALRESEKEADAVRTILAKHGPDIQAAKFASDGALSEIKQLQIDFPPEKCLPGQPHNGIPYPQIRQKYADAIVKLRSAHEEYLAQIDGLYDELQANLNFHATRMVEHELLNENNAPSLWKGGALSAAILLALYETGKKGGVRSIQYAGWPLRPFRNVPVLRTIMKPYYFAANIGNALTRPVTGTYDVLARRRGWPELPRIREDWAATDRLIRRLEQDLAARNRELAALRSVPVATSGTAIPSDLVAAEQEVHRLQEELNVAMQHRDALAAAETAVEAAPVAESTAPADPGDVAAQTERMRLERVQALRSEKAAKEFYYATRGGSTNPDCVSEFARIDLELERLEKSVPGWNTTLDGIETEAKNLATEFENLRKIPVSPEAAAEGAVPVSRSQARTALLERARQLRTAAAQLEASMPLNTRHRLRTTATQLFGPEVMTDDCWRVVESIHGVQDPLKAQQFIAEALEKGELNPQQVRAVKRLMEVGVAGGRTTETVAASTSRIATSAAVDTVEVSRLAAAAKAANSPLVRAGVISAAVLADALFILHNEVRVRAMDEKGDHVSADILRKKSIGLMAAGAGNALTFIVKAGLFWPASVAMTGGTVYADYLYDHAIELNNLSSLEGLKGMSRTDLLKAYAGISETWEWADPALSFGKVSGLDTRRNRRENLLHAYLLRGTTPAPGSRHMPEAEAWFSSLTDEEQQDQVHLHHSRQIAIAEEALELESSAAKQWYEALPEVTKQNWLKQHETPEKVIDERIWQQRAEHASEIAFHKEEYLRFASDGIFAKVDPRMLRRADLYGELWELKQTKGAKDISYEAGSGAIHTLALSALPEVPKTQKDWDNVSKILSQYQEYRMQNSRVRFAALCIDQQSGGTEYARSILLDHLKHSIVALDVRISTEIGDGPRADAIRLESRRAVEGMVPAFSNALNNGKYRISFIQEYLRSVEEKMLHWDLEALYRNAIPTRVDKQGNVYQSGKLVRLSPDKLQMNADQYQTPIPPMPEGFNSIKAVLVSERYAQLSAKQVTRTEAEAMVVNAEKDVCASLGIPSSKLALVSLVESV